MIYKKVIDHFLKDYNWLFSIAGFILGLLVFPALHSLFENPWAFLQDLVPETLGLLATVFIIDRIYDWRNTQALKKQLVREARSRTNPTAVTAIESLRDEKWLQGSEGLLVGQKMRGAKLQGADFGKEANLSGVDFSGADLSNTKLTNANLSGSDLSSTNLSGANLSCVDFSNMELNLTNLSGAILDGANFHNATLSGVNLSQTDLSKSILTEVTFQGHGVMRMPYDLKMIKTDLSNSKIDSVDLSKSTFRDVKAVDAFFRRADLRESYLEKVNLSRSDLRGVDLTESIIKSVNMSGANLSGAELYKAQLSMNIYDEHTALPDSRPTMNPEVNEEYLPTWEPKIDMNEFTKYSRWNRNDD